MGEDLDVGRVLLAELVELLVTLLDLLVQRLVLDLQLLEVNDLQALLAC